ncbi:aminotransferase class I/II-fold pyridoxal phosphate-dependent enzyme [Acinetobacter bereziniae]|uniref:methionine aminotransferase n=1 Tax=Acinetobacter TaxID=469 RepID=UPI000EF6D91F|nr:MULTISPECIES: methionine aminotransferase [Acinetobacter]MBJ8422591.1 aminotransferase class I/II-fold pyridoxal phosphate-dependent enzyme [Acinetobacter bereziniae]MCU4473764.1 aminotransferase class I/II-fold pyridoxal phosphate-dependent enzyme [Acinetobacter bereziniae]MCU4541436.1 aminotransferase class I/II-fold pyridoxal phosphate-dependent enzyme [Acinetobacter bereziniae]MCU4625993.1 aminotransferase class I/II-fold pyridoxal phosphate-dependent enzyme [Acinetobacter bereziniae]BC
MIEIHSKLPAQGVTIFSIMTAMAQRLNALNLSQGFPDFDAPPALLQALSQATLDGFNQYAAGDGLLQLRQQLAQLFHKRDQLQLDPLTEITITPGATIGIFSVIQAIIHQDDEVIIFDPSYDSYAPSVQLVGGKAVHIPLNAPEFSVDWDQVKSAITDKTRMVIVNTPHNPTGAIWSKQDWLNLIELIQDKNIIVLSDEVYEHLIFDGEKHYSALSFPALRDRSFVVGSFGKTFHVTGWKTGYCIASPELMKVFRQIYQFANFCGVTPVQMALANFMQQHPEHIDSLASFYQQKRDLFNSGIQDSKFSFIPSKGTFFQNVDYSQIRPDLNDVEMCKFLAEEHKIVAIPVSVFYQKAPENLRLIRFCFAKKDQTLVHACEILNRI